MFSYTKLPQTQQQQQNPRFVVVGIVNRRSDKGHYGFLNTPNVPNGIYIPKKLYQSLKPLILQHAVVVLEATRVKGATRPEMVDYRVLRLGAPGSDGQAKMARATGGAGGQAKVAGATGRQAKMARATGGAAGTAGCAGGQAKMASATGGAGGQAKMATSRVNPGVSLHRTSSERSLRQTEIKLKFAKQQEKAHLQNLGHLKDQEDRIKQRIKDLEEREQKLEADHRARQLQRSVVHAGSETKGDEMEQMVSHKLFSSMVTFVRPPVPPAPPNGWSVYIEKAGKWIPLEKSAQTVIKRRKEFLANPDKHSVSVYWTKDQKWYPGKVVSFLNNDVHVNYDDGDQRVYSKNSFFQKDVKWNGESLNHYEIGGQRYSIDTQFNQVNVNTMKKRPISEDGGSPSLTSKVFPTLLEPSSSMFGHDDWHMAMSLLTQAGSPRDMFKTIQFPTMTKERQAKLDAIKSGGRVIVGFHGTDKPAAMAILEKGLKIGGDEVSVKNGTAHGMGVYFSVTTTDPVEYESGALVMVFADSSKCEKVGTRPNWRIARSTEHVAVFAVAFR